MTYASGIKSSSISLASVGSRSIIQPLAYGSLLTCSGVFLSALLTATVVLSKQDRLARLAERREHLDLKVALLTEQKVAKLIDLMEELRRDLPNVKDRHDSDAAVLQQAMKPEQVLAALDERVDPEKNDQPAQR